MPRSPMSSRNGWPERVGGASAARRARNSDFQQHKGSAMRRLVIVSALSFAAASAYAQSKEPIGLREMGSFHVGGRVIEITGQPIKEVVFTPGGVPAKVDPNGKYQVEQMYVQYFLPQNRKGRLPLLLWHGGGLTGVTYETKPDGGDGWLTYFIRKGWDSYISDAVKRGRSGWTSTFKGEAVALPQGDPWERFRIGPAGSWNADKSKRATYPGTQFPVDAYDQFMKQGVPRWLSTDDQIGGRARSRWSTRSAPAWSWCTASPARSATRCWKRGPTRSRRWSRWSRRWAATATRWTRSRDTPVLVVYGDNAKDHPRWSKIPPGRCRLRGGAQGRRRQHRYRRSARRRYPGKFPHGHDGQEQRPGGRPDPEVAGRQGSRGMRLRCGAT